ncbi:hypothetical protein AB0M68_37595 [Streptomyces sp. NPDC051453]|uniref:hypothetical protein n=1 Tax=Streptomyces sp. NPDC051453 TaxID=3154941 RepID=UPI00341531A7
MDFFDFLSGNWPNVRDARWIMPCSSSKGPGPAAPEGLPMAVLVYRTRRPRAPFWESRASSSEYLRTLLSACRSPARAGQGPSTAALTMYAPLPVIRNTVVGLREVDPAVVEPARLDDRVGV